MRANSFEEGPEMPTLSLATKGSPPRNNLTPDAEAAAKYATVRFASNRGFFSVGKKPE
jgi:hypothetical protein